ncbi:MAG: DUF1501 domain-containing protein [Verrucomicrobiae bacterium]|nr:DUF1501 domain-containing protein [Verrucomicrobiae bacterium]NNJ44080.1 DUF1501 domain-containing protein [Akkermansiaceae bacterium]
MNLSQQLQHDYLQHQSRRQFLSKCVAGVGAAWLSSITDQVIGSDALHHPQLSHIAPKAKRVIFLHMAGAPSQLELFDFKPELKKLDGKPTPMEYLEGQRFAFIQGVPKLLNSIYPFHQAGESGQWISDRLPHFEKVIDDVCFIKSMHTNQFNHAPAQLLLHTGNANLGNPSIGSWVTYGLGSENENLPGYISLVSGGKTPSAGKSVWGSGFLPSVYQGVQCRSKGDPVLYLSNPKGVPRNLRRATIDTITQINQQAHAETNDPETLTRIAQYELAFRMQIHANEAFNLKEEPQHIHNLYGTEPGKESFANNCLLARRLAERGVRYIQLFDWGWDSHGAGANEALNTGFKKKCQEVDQPMHALLTDLKQRGLLEDTLVVWGGEFGRTPMRENRGGKEMKLIGRDHNPGAFTMWLAGAGIKPGISYGETDPIGNKATQNPVSTQDLQATILHLLGLKHNKLTYPFQGLDQTLPGVTEPARVIDQILA